MRCPQVSGDALKVWLVHQPDPDKLQALHTLAVYRTEARKIPAEEEDCIGTISVQ